MDLRPEGYHDLTKFLMPGPIKFSSWRAMADAGLEIVTAFRFLHKKGYSYQDLNDGNFFIEPIRGKVKIADNDNVAPEGTNTGILGKPRFMAPEIVRGEVKPNANTDRYSLALILFMIFCGGHPLEGEVGTPFILTGKISERIYGTKPIFVYDPDDCTNRPVVGVHSNVITLWKLLPTYMKEIFLRSFSQESLKYGKARASELDWIKVLVRFRSDILKCRCGNEVFTENAQSAVCDKCGKKIVMENAIRLRDYKIPAVVGTRIYSVQVMTVNQDRALDPIAIAVAKADNPKMVGLRNLSKTTWDCITSTGNNRTLEAGGVVPIKAGIKIGTSEYGFEII